MDHEYFMKEALKQAYRGYLAGEIPVGAVVVNNKRIVAKSYNQVKKLKDATAHAEMIALTAAGNHLGTKYLNSSILYTTLEPCFMCAGAIYWYQIKKIIFGCRDEKQGFLKFSPSMIHPKTTVEYGLLKNASSKIIKDFFESIRTLAK